MEVLVDNGALRALHPFKNDGAEGEGESEGASGAGGLALSPPELAAASAGMRDAGEGWYRIRAVGKGGAAAAVVVMTSVPVVRWL